MAVPLPEFLETGDEGSVVITEGKSIGLMQDQLTFLRSLDEPPRYEYIEGNNMDSTFGSSDSNTVLFTQVEITILKRLNEEFLSEENKDWLPF